MGDKVKKKICMVLLTLIILSSVILISNCYAADDVLGKLEGMSKVSETESVSGNDGIIGAIKSIVGLLQLTGSGIAIIVVTLLGVKYILASPSDKADVKKSIMPIIIGCSLLFGAVNLAAAIADFTSQL